MTVRLNSSVEAILAWLERNARWVRSGLRVIARVWRSWSLARQFAACAAMVLLPAMLVMGLWVSSRIEESVTQSAGASAALYIENFFEPLVQELASSDRISPANAAKLARLLSETTLGQKVLTFKIWKQDGLVVASSRPELVGQHLPPSVGLKRAATGILSIAFDKLTDVENAFEKGSGIPLLEVYIPLRARGSGRIIAVAEFYEKAGDLETELNRAQFLSWLVVSAVTLSMLSALFAIVRRGSQTIEQQRGNLERRIGELSNLLAENRRLRLRAHDASARMSESSESYLRRIGADLHDGPAQLISLALLRLDDAVITERLVPGEVSGTPARKSTDQVSVRSVLNDALRDIRNITAGLSLPEIDALPLEQALRAVVARHQKLTGTTVEVRFGLLPAMVPHALKLCAYRFVQEGLSNAYRHAQSAGQRVSATVEKGEVVLAVTDKGSGLGRDQPAARSGLGLKGLTDRIESLGGTLDIVTSRERGTRLTARLPLVREAALDG